MQPVAVDDEPAGVELFEINVAGGNAAGGQVGGGEADCLGLVHGRGSGLRKPRVELGERRGGELGTGERAFGVLICLRVGIRAGWGDCAGKGELQVRKEGPGMVRLQMSFEFSLAADIVAVER